MKKTLCGLLLCVWAFADVIISPSSLPESIQTFIGTHFQAGVGLAQMDRKHYEIYLTDGTELEFDFSGEWRDIESQLTPLSFDILPANVAAIVRAQFPDASIIELKRKFHYYKIKLTNQMEMKIDPNGTVLSVKFDD